MFLTEELHPAHLDLHRAEASSVIVHNVAPENAERFLQWQNGITVAAESFPGYRSTEVYPPANDSQRQWVVAIHFDDRSSLDRWLKSPVRMEWINKLDRDLRDYQLKMLNDGFGPWFAKEFADSASQPPAGWKMALTVLLGLYPTVMLLSIFLGPYLSRFGFALAMLISNALSVSILQWLVMPGLTRVLRPWLNEPATKSRLALTVVGSFGIGATLAVLAVCFHYFTN